MRDFGLKILMPDHGSSTEQALLVERNVKLKLTRPSVLNGRTAGFDAASCLKVHAILDAQGDARLRLPTQVRIGDVQPPGGHSRNIVERYKSSGGDTRLEVSLAVQAIAAFHVWKHVETAGTSWLSV